MQEVDPQVAQRPPVYPPHGPEKTDRWYSCGEHQQLGGVCAGLGEYLGVDRNMVRLITVLVSFMSSGAILLAYIVLFFVLPRRPDTRPKNATKVVLVLLLVAAATFIVLTDRAYGWFSS